MARIEWVKQRLENWALWNERESHSGLGYPSQSAFMNVARSNSIREAHVPVDEIEASITDEAVRALSVSRPLQHKTLMLYYIAGQGISGTSRMLACSCATVHSHLDQVDRAIANWLGERAEAQRTQKKSFTP